jgi:hypothetical protein
VAEISDSQVFMQASSAVFLAVLAALALRSLIRKWMHAAPISAAMQRLATQHTVSARELIINVSWALGRDCAESFLTAERARRQVPPAKDQLSNPFFQFQFSIFLLFSALYPLRARLFVCQLHR